MGFNCEANTRPRLGQQQAESQPAFLVKHVDSQTDILLWVSKFEGTSKCNRPHAQAQLCPVTSLSFHTLTLTNRILV